MQSSPHKKSGVALITAILVVALAAVAAVSIASRVSLDTRRTSNVLESDQVSLFAQSAEAWSIQLLKRDQKDSKTDTLDEDWAQVLEPVKVEDGNLTSRAEDMQGRFNLNNLITDGGSQSKDDVAGFKRMLKALGLDQDLADAIVDWMDNDSNSTLPGGAEDVDYLAKDPPYRTANSRMASMSELLLVKGFDRETYDKLAPYISVLPERTAINVNTASAVVLMAAVEGLSQGDADSLVEQRGEKGYADLNEFKGQQALEGRQIKNASVNSQYFMLETTAQVGRVQERVYSLLVRDNQDNNVTVKTIMRSRGVY